MQRHEVEVLEFVPYEEDESMEIQERHSNIELDGAKIDDTITEDPYVLHLLDLEKNAKGSKEVIGIEWCENILGKIGSSDELDDYMAILCYGIDGEIWEYLLDEEGSEYRLDYTDPSQYEVLPEYRKIMEEREQ